MLRIAVAGEDEKLVGRGFSSAVIETALSSYPGFFTTTPPTPSVGYAVYQGASVFEALAQRMETIPELNVQLFLNIARPDNDTTPATILVSRYSQRFRDSQWPKDCRLPAVYYDPRSVAEDKRSSLHAKCVVVDAEQVFVSSANFTKAGQERNIEVGLKIQSPWLAGRLIRHFQLLHENGLAVRAF